MIFEYLVTQSFLYLLESLPKSFAYFKMGFLFLLWISSSLHILDTNLVGYMYLKYFPQSVVYLLIFLMVSYFGCTVKLEGS